MNLREEEHPLTRLGFLQRAALATGGLGLAAVAGCDSNRGAASEVRRGYVVALTNGPANPDKVMLALVTATRFPAGENYVWFSIDGGQVAKREEAEKLTSPLFTQQGSASEVIAKIRSQGTVLHI